MLLLGNAALTPSMCGLLPSSSGLDVEMAVLSARTVGFVPALTTSLPCILLSLRSLWTLRMGGDTLLVRLPSWNGAVAKDTCTRRESRTGCLETSSVATAQGSLYGRASTTWPLPIPKSLRRCKMSPPRRPMSLLVRRRWWDGGVSRDMSGEHVLRTALSSEQDALSALPIPSSRTSSVR